MKIKKLQQNKRIIDIIHTTEIFTKCVIKLSNKDYPIDLTIIYEDYYGGENYLLSVMVEKLNPWDESCKEYMDIESYIKNCVKKIYSSINYVAVSKQLMKFVQQILQENEIENLWE